MDAPVNFSLGPYSASWQDDAICFGMPSELFVSHSTLPDRYDEGRGVCRKCPVQNECLRNNLDAEVGLYGGLDEDERRLIWMKQ